MDAVKDLEDPNSATNILGLRGYIESALALWTLGEVVRATEKGKAEFLKRLCPPPTDIWEIRVRAPVVHARLFGRFAEPDTLVLTKFHTRGLLGKKRSAAWASTMADCANAWKALFPDNPPFTARTIHEYVTENCDDYPLC